jgi:hypothetical protein
MSKGFEPVLVIRQETMVLPKAEPPIVEGVVVVVKVRCNEPIFNQHNGSIVKGLPRDSQCE